MAEIARKAMEKRKGVTVEGLSAKKMKATLLRVPSSRVSGPKTNEIEKATASTKVIYAMPLCSVPPADNLRSKHIMPLGRLHRQQGRRW